MNKKVLNDLYDYKDRKIYQDDNNFKFSLDSILLAEFVEKPRRNAKILDMCTGNAPVPLILSTKYKNDIVGFEIQEKIFDMAQASVDINDCNNQITLFNDDINNIKNYFPGNNFDIITCNPPYFKYHSSSLLNNNEIKSIARHEIKINLENIMQIAVNNLNTNGIFYLVHRPERIDEIIYFALKYGLSVKKIQLIETKIDSNPTILLVKMVKGGNSGVKVSKIINISDYKTYQNIFN